VTGAFDAGSEIFRDLPGFHAWPRSGFDEPPFASHQIDGAGNDGGSRKGCRRSSSKTSPTPRFPHPGF